MKYFIFTSFYLSYIFQNLNILFISKFKLEIKSMILYVISDFWTPLNIRTFSTHDILKMEHDPTLQRIISLKDQIRPVDTCFNCIIIC